MSRLGPPLHPFDAGRVEISAIAIEQALELAQRGITPATVLEALGVSWRAFRAPGWYDAQLALSCAWRSLRKPSFRRAA